MRLENFQGFTLVDEQLSFTKNYHIEEQLLFYEFSSAEMFNFGQILVSFWLFLGLIRLVLEATHKN